MGEESVVIAAAMATVRTAGELAGLDCDHAELLRGHSNFVFRLEHEPVVVRIGPAPAALERARNAVRVTGWLTGLGFPTVTPLPEIDQPLVVGEHVVTFWRYLPQPAGYRAPVAALGRVLRRFHDLPPPPFPLPRNQPMRRLRDAMAGTDVLTADQADFLARRREELTRAHEALEFVLPPGLIHGDAHRGNLLYDRERPEGDRIVLCDWDSVSVGPREWDLVPTHHGQRFGLSEADRAGFAAAYGYDLTEWSGFPVLRDLRDLFTLGAYIRNARNSPAARRELEHRLRSLLDGDLTRRWYPL